MKKFLFLFLFLATACCMVAQTEKKNGVVIDHGAQKIVDALAKKLQNDLPLSFDVSYNITQDNKSIEKGKGSFLSSGSKYRIVSDNFNDYCDGNTLWHYDKKNNEVEISEIEEGKSMFNFVRIINIYAKSYRPKLIRKDVLNKKQVNIIDLTPNKRSAVTKVRLWVAISDNTLLQMQVNINDGSKNTYTFSNYKSKVSTKQNDFAFPKSQFPNAKQVDL
ncbi:MAG: outer membrane lipoprotein carrier protein LolA, partial [Bacteroidota bacterium]|nr:outer membrane lipoprotein carrier protein LolA [Bacteroidota bacterium]